jgi:hypothetical protein
MKKTLLASVALIGAVALAEAAIAAPVLIDNFNTTQNLTIPSGGSNPTNISGSVATGANAIGGSRTIDLTRTSGLGSAEASANIVTNGVLAFDTASSTIGAARLTWNAGGAGLGNADLTGGGTNQVFDVAIRSDLVAQLTLTVTSDGGTSSWTFNAPGNGSGNPFVDLLLDFNNPTSSTGTGADLTAADQIQLFINSNNVTSFDGQIDFIQARGVPEPITLALFGASLIGLGVARRRKIA